MEKQLNELLADMTIESHKMLHYHWYVKGINFYNVHVRTEQFYHDFVKMCDEIAEMMLMMGYKPIANLKEMLDITHIKELKFSYIEESVINEGMLIDFDYLLYNMKNIKSLADETERDLIVTKLDEYIYYLNRNIWMIKQSLNN